MSISSPRVGKLYLQFEQLLKSTHIIDTSYLGKFEALIEELVSFSSEAGADGIGEYLMDILGLYIFPPTTFGSEFFIISPVINNPDSGSTSIASLFLICRNERSK